MKQKQNLAQVKQQKKGLYSWVVQPLLATLVFWDKFYFAFLR